MLSPAFRTGGLPNLDDKRQTKSIGRTDSESNSVVDSGLSQRRETKICPNDGETKQDSCRKQKRTHNQRGMKVDLGVVGFHSARKYQELNKKGECRAEIGYTSSKNPCLRTRVFRSLVISLGRNAIHWGDDDWSKDTNAKKSASGVKQVSNVQSRNELKRITALLALDIR